MISIFFISILICFFNCAFKNNPVKMKFSLMIASFFIFLLMKNMSSNSWLPLIFAMIFLGGILMMFMILSSFLPNSKMKFNKSYILILAIFFPFLPNMLFLNSQVQTLKTFMEDKINFIFMMVWLLAIFFGFILILSECQLSMRSTLTH